MSGFDPDDFTSPYPPLDVITSLRSYQPDPPPARIATIQHLQADTVLAQLVAYELDHASSYQNLVGGIQANHVEYGHLTLKQASAIFGRLKAAKLAFDPAWFRIRLNEFLDHTTARKMSALQIKLILPALTLEQRSEFMDMRFA